MLFVRFSPRRVRPALPIALNWAHSAIFIPLCYTSERNNVESKRNAPCGDLPTMYRRKRFRYKTRYIAIQDRNY